MDYTWMYGPSAKYELAGRLKPWLVNACKERGIKVTGLSRAALKQALIEWQEAEGLG